MAVPAEVERCLREWLGESWQAEPLAGDASVRGYYRVRCDDGPSRILAWYPEAVRPQLARFLAAYEALAGHGAVPEVLRHSEAAVLQEDAGDVTLYQVLRENREEGLRLYAQAVRLLVRFQKAPDPHVNPPFTAAFFLSELEMTCDFYVGRLMEGEASSAVPLMRELCENLERHPYVLCHRDFHGQNIHIRTDHLFLIDYQDLRMGPDTYDLASLLRDRGVAALLGRAAELELLDLYGAAREEGPELRERYFETLLQRSLKILGTFARQPIERGRMHYLEYIPAALESVERCLEELPRYRALRAALPLEFSPARALERAQELNQRQ